MSRLCSECEECFSWESGRFSKTQWMKGEGGGGRCKNCVSASGSVGGHTGDGSGGFSTVRGNHTNKYASEDSSSSCQAEVFLGRGVFASGQFKDVYKGSYTTGSRRGETCVFKEFRKGVRTEADWFDKDVRAAQQAAKLLGKFNEIRLTRV